MVGYKVHLTETCDEEKPHLIVNVETTPATTPDDNMIKPVHESLKGRAYSRGSTLSTRDTRMLMFSSRAKASMV